MEVKLNGKFEDIKLFKIHADYRPLNMQKTTNYYYVYGWNKPTYNLLFYNLISIFLQALKTLGFLPILFNSSLVIFTALFLASLLP